MEEKDKKIIFTLTRTLMHVIKDIAPEADNYSIYCSERCMSLSVSTDDERYIIDAFDFGEVER